MKQLVLIVVSLIVFLASSFSMYGTWLLLASIEEFYRGIAAIFVWIVVFACGSLLFWKIAEKMSTSLRE
jgi:hypothetical protein